MDVREKNVGKEREINMEEIREEREINAINERESKIMR